jgi:hypothetical protein
MESVTPGILWKCGLLHRGCSLDSAAVGPFDPIHIVKQATTNEQPHELSHLHSGQVGSVVFLTRLAPVLQYWERHRVVSLGRPRKTPPRQVSTTLARALPFSSDYRRLTTDR